MPPRASKLTPERREALRAELRLFEQLEQRATMDKYVHVAMANAAGMTLREIAEVYDISPDTAQRWKDAGERERERHRGGDPVGN